MKLKEWEVSSRLFECVVTGEVDKYGSEYLVCCVLERMKEEIETFWYDLKKLIDSCGNNKVVHLLGNSTAQVGDRKINGMIGRIY